MHCYHFRLVAGVEALLILQQDKLPNTLNHCLSSRADSYVLWINLQFCDSQSTIALCREVGVLHRVIYPIAHKLPELVHSHPGYLVSMALPREGVILLHIKIPVINVSVVSPGVDVGPAAIFMHCQH